MEFHAKEQLPGLLDWMRQQMKACGGKTAVIGISGGKDSATVAALAVAAYGKENVVGVLMPNGVQPDIWCEQTVSSALAGQDAVLLRAIEHLEEKAGER